LRLKEIKGFGFEILFCFYQVIATHRAVAECVVISRDDDLKGQVPMRDLRPIMH
jgi:hypothetical protein